MKKYKQLIATLLLTATQFSVAQTPAFLNTASFESSGSDRTAIETVLTTYSQAVSTKNEALFETILLNKNISFSEAIIAAENNGSPGSTSRYDSFRRSVFGGDPFTQKFENVHILQDGSLADVSLVFINTSATKKSWGWKSLQLLKIDGRWKIASEFYTLHRDKK